MVAGLPLSADAYIANRDWGLLMLMSLSAYMGGLKKDGDSTSTILLTTIVCWRLARLSSFLHNLWMYESVAFPRHSCLKYNCLYVQKLIWL